LTLIFGVHSCNEDSINNTGENIVRKEIEYSEFEPNLNNSYNYIGELHNEIIHSFVTDYSDDELSIEEIISIVESIANANESFLSIKGEDYVPVSPSLILQGINDLDNNFHSIIDSLDDVSTLAKGKLKTLVNHFFDSADLEEEPDYLEFDNYLANFEEEILQDSSNYSPLENSILLSAVATARYSTFYWNNYYKNNGANYRSASDDNPPQRRWWHWVIVGVADTAGVIAGAAVNPGVAVTSGSAASTAAYTMTNPRTK